MMVNLNKFIYIAIITYFVFGLLSIPAEARLYTTSRYYCLMDSHTGQVLVSKGLDELRPVASTTKMMTAIMANEYAGLDEIAVVSQKAAKTAPFTIGLRYGQELTVSELLKVSLIRSSNDAAVVLAEHIAGDERLFAHLMSKKAFVIGAVNTHFENASGLPANNHYSTAYDLAQIGRYLLSNSYIAELVATRKVDFQHPGYAQPLTITNTNGLLEIYPGADGIKTGTTNAAGKCLVASATRNGRQLIAVVLKSGDRKGDCVRLLDYGFNKTQLCTIIDTCTPFKTIRPVKADATSINIYPADDVCLWKGEKNPNIEKRVDLNYQINAPIKNGDVLGKLDIYADGKLATSVNLICRQDVSKEPGFIQKLLKAI